MEEQSTKAMQEALQAAVARMNAAPSEPRANPMETLAPLLSMLPMLLQNRGGEDVAEKLDELRKEEIGALRQQVLVLRKQCARLLKSQEQVIDRLRDVQRQQRTAGDAVLELAHQMARIRFVGDVPPGEEEDGYERDFPLAPESTLWPRSRTSRDLRSRNLREATGRARP